MYSDLQNIVYNYLDLDDILRLPDRSVILQSPHFKNYNWLYENFGLINNHYRKQLLKSSKNLHDFIVDYKKYWKCQEINFNDIQLIVNTRSILENRLIAKMGNSTYNIESLKNIITDIVKCEMEDSVDDDDMENDDEKMEESLSRKSMIKLNSLYKKEIFDYINTLLSGEYETVGIHPDYYPIGYLCCGILYDQNWEKLIDLDIDKFACSYGVNLELCREQKIIQIIKGQNKVLKQILDSGEDGICRSCPIIKKLIQKIIDDQIITE